MQTRIKELQTRLPYNYNIISDPKMIQYYTGTYFECGERLLALIVSKDSVFLVLNALFSPLNTIETISYHDHENPIAIIKDRIKGKELGVDGNWPTKFSLQFIPEYTLYNISPILDHQRAIKDRDEVNILSIASNYNDQIMEKVKDLLKVGVTEIEVANQIKEMHSTYPLEGISFDPIVVFTENIADPHGVPSNRILKQGDVILVDMGGYYKGYASDMTRAFFTKGANPELEKIYNIVKEANEKAIEAIKPGMTFKELDSVARNIITEAGYGQYFTHRLGHGVGIDVHETLDVSQANDTIIEPGMCFSIEPGIYIEGLGGIRIEDLVIVEEDGVHVLNSYPKTLAYID